MTKENEQDKKILDFVPNLLSGLQSIEANRYNEIYQFFKTAFLELTDHDLFEDSTYRLQWSNHLSVIESTSIAFKDYSDDEMRMAIEVAIKVLEKIERSYSMSSPILKFVYPNGHILESKSRDFKNAIKFVFEAPGLKEHTPLKIIVESTGKVFYFNKIRFREFINDEITLEELVYECQCEGLYRNNETIVFNDTIDSGSLWKLIDGNFILIDSERYCHTKADFINFTQV